MKKHSDILWLVSARAGSKSIPHKNIKLLGGLPLLAHRIRSARKIADRKDIWISTDSPRYVRIAEKFGATAPFLRPAHLAGDRAKSEDMVLHAMAHAEKLGRRYKALGLLEPTSPFIHHTELEAAAAQLLRNPKADSIVAVRRVRPSTFYVQPNTGKLERVAANIASKGLLRRQDEHEEITPSGGFYIAKWDAFLKNKTFYTAKTLSYLVPDLHGLEIDEPIDWSWAEFLIQKRLVRL